MLELSSEKDQRCRKMMADVGADLIKIEPPGEDDARSMGPFLDDIPHGDPSLYFWHYNTSKRGITLDLETVDGRELFRRLASSADLVLETFSPGYMASLGLGYDDQCELNSKFIVCSITPFGQTGPSKGFKTCDLVHLPVFRGPNAATTRGMIQTGLLLPWEADKPGVPGPTTPTWPSQRP